MARKLRITIALMVVSLLLVGCKPEPVITLSFDGEECIHSGPETLSVEEVTIILDFEEIEGRRMMHQFILLDEGKTWEDFLATFPNDGAGGELEAGIIAPPPFFNMVSGTTGENEGEYIYTIEPGTYVTFCIIQSPFSVYPGGQLIVE